MNDERDVSGWCLSMQILSTFLVMTSLVVTFFGFFTGYRDLFFWSMAVLAAGQGLRACAFKHELLRRGVRV
jgi:hypothetical protein